MRMKAKDQNFEHGKHENVESKEISYEEQRRKHTLANDTANSTLPYESRSILDEQEHIKMINNMKYTSQYPIKMYMSKLFHINVRF